MASDQERSSPPTLVRGSRAGNVGMLQRWGDTLTPRTMGISRLYHPAEFNLAIGLDGDGRALRRWDHPAPSSPDAMPQDVEELLIAGPTLDSVHGEISSQPWHGNADLAASLAEWFTVANIATYGRA